MRRTACTAEGLLVERVVNAISLGGLLSRQVPRPGRLLVAVVLVTELRGAVTRADRQIHALAASVPVRELAIQVVGIGRIGVAEAVPAFPQGSAVGVLGLAAR